MRIQRLVVELLKTATDEKLQAIIAMGIAKLVYSRVINAHIVGDLYIERLTD